MLYLMNSGFLKEESRRLAELTRGMADAERVSDLILRTMSRPATQRDIEQARQFVSDFRGGLARKGFDGDVELEAWARYCHALFASSEFLYRR